MKSKINGLKSLFENIFEESISATGTVSAIVQSIEIIASESKKLADALIHINERLNHHEKIIVELCNMLTENVDKKQNFNSLSLKPLKTNKDSKPN